MISLAEMKVWLRYLKKKVLNLEIIALIVILSVFGIILFEKFYLENSSSAVAVGGLFAKMKEYITDAVNSLSGDQILDLLKEGFGIILTLITTVIFTNRFSLRIASAFENTFSSIAEQYNSKKVLYIVETLIATLIWTFILVTGILSTDRMFFFDGANRGFVISVVLVLTIFFLAIGICVKIYKLQDDGIMKIRAYLYTAIVIDLLICYPGDTTDIIGDFIYAFIVAIAFVALANLTDEMNNLAIFYFNDDKNGRLYIRNLMDKDRLLCTDTPKISNDTKRFIIKYDYINAKPIIRDADAVNKEWREAVSEVRNIRDNKKAEKPQKSRKASTARRTFWLIKALHKKVNNINAEVKKIDEDIEDIRKTIG